MNKIFPYKSRFLGKQIDETNATNYPKVTIICTYFHICCRKYRPPKLVRSKGAIQIDQLFLNKCSALGLVPLHQVNYLHNIAICNSYDLKQNNLHPLSLLLTIDQLFDLPKSDSTGLANERIWECLNLFLQYQKNHIVAAFHNVFSEYMTCFTNVCLHQLQRISLLKIYLIYLLSQYTTYSPLVYFTLASYVFSQEKNQQNIDMCWYTFQWFVSCFIELSNTYMI